MEENRSFLESLTGLANILASVAIVLTAFVGWKEYYRTGIQDKIVMSYSVSREYRSPFLTKRREEIVDKLFADFAKKEVYLELRDVERQAQICLVGPQADSSGVDLSNEELSNQVKCNALRSVLEFFDSAYECVKLDGCDKATMTRLLSEEANQIWVFAYPFVNAGLESYPRYGLGLRCIRDAFDCEDYADSRLNQTRNSTQRIKDLQFKPIT